MELRIDGWRGNYRFAAAHIIPGHPTCGRIHGHTYAISLTIHGRQGEHGFIMDFNDVKRALSGVIQSLDHKFLLAAKSADMQVRIGAETIEFGFGGKRYVLPASDVEALPIENASAEDLANHVADRLLGGTTFPATVDRVDVGVHEGYGKSAWTSRRVTV
ncbi:MAG: 6-pyruvoyl trahydropterin synthase family protein [Methanobacteriota archaeon]